MAHGQDRELCSQPFNSDVAGGFYGDLWSQALAMDIFSEFQGEVPPGWRWFSDGDLTRKNMEKYGKMGWRWVFNGDLTWFDIPDISWFLLGDLTWFDFWSGNLGMEYDKMGCRMMLSSPTSDDWWVWKCRRSVSQNSLLMAILWSTIGECYCHTSTHTYTH